MSVRFFLGACFLTGALLLPHAPVLSILAGMVLAGILTAAWTRTHRR